MGTWHRGGLPGGNSIAHAHGLFNMLGGLWPLLHRRSFEALFGTKNDRWLLYTVGGLLTGNGVVQILSTDSAEGWRRARDLGVATATVLLTIDLLYVPAGRIPKMYLLDAAVEIGWLAAWARETSRRPRQPHPRL
ncbi:hypothetical protein H5400_37035 [Rhodococcus wratislaviensis]|nr:hypothetical protein [Rhodococcus sp. 3A]MBC2897930.1 hypothetical protein [Rhodococcus sp. 4CII]